MSAQHPGCLPRLVAPTIGSRHSCGILLVATTSTELYHISVCNCISHCCSTTMMFCPSLLLMPFLPVHLQDRIRCSHQHLLCYQQLVQPMQTIVKKKPASGWGSLTLSKKATEPASLPHPGQSGAGRVVTGCVVTGSVVARDVVTGSVVTTGTRLPGGQTARRGDSGQGRSTIRLIAKKSTGKWRQTVLSTAFSPPSARIAGRRGGGGLFTPHIDTTTEMNRAVLKCPNSCTNSVWTLPSLIQGCTKQTTLRVVHP